MIDVSVVHRREVSRIEVSHLRNEMYSWIVSFCRQGKVTFGIFTDKQINIASEDIGTV